MTHHATIPVRPRRRSVAAALAGTAIAALVLAPGAALAADDETVTFVSDTSWTVQDGDAGIGPSLALPAPAQHVCLNASSPNPCPGDATVFGWAGSGWGADLSAIPGATWIWAPGIDAATTPADADTYRFAKTISVPGTPQSGTIWVAADDNAEVFVNGASAGSSTGQGALAMLDVTSLLVDGENEVVVRASNSVQCNQDCTYQSNPAGVVFGGSFTYAPAATATPGGADPTGRPRITTPPTSTLDVVPSGRAGDGFEWLLLALGAASLAMLGLSHRVERRKR